MGVLEGEEREQKVENLFEGNRHIRLGRTESPKQDEAKETHTKTHHN